MENELILKILYLIFTIKYNGKLIINKKIIFDLQLNNE